MKFVAVDQISSTGNAAENFFRSFFRSFARSLVARISRRRENFRPRENLGKKSLSRRDRFRPKIVEIGAILAIFEPFEN